MAKAISELKQKNVVIDVQTSEQKQELVIDVRIKGVKPLLMHSTAGMLKPKNSKIRSAEHDPVEEARDCLYLNEAGKICVPSFAILSSMRKAGAQLKKPGSGKKTLRDFVFSGLQIEPDMIELPNQEYEIDIRPVVVGRARIMRARPLFKDWGLSFQIIIRDHQTWDPGSVRGVLTEAGLYQGLLDFRPLFGTFEVVSMSINGKEVR